MELPEGQERVAIQNSIELWRTAENGRRTIIELGIYGALQRYLPDTNSELGLLQTMLPFFFDSFGFSPRLEVMGDVRLWTTPEGEIKGCLGRQDDVPKDAMSVPFQLLKSIMLLHASHYAARAAQEYGHKIGPGQK